MLPEHDAGVARHVQGASDSRVVDLSGTGFAAAGDVGDLDLANPVNAVLMSWMRFPSPIWAW